MNGNPAGSGVERRVLGVMIVAIGAVLVLAATLGLQPVGFAVGTLDVPTVVQRLMPLFVTSLFIERAVEVILTTWRAEGAGALETKISQAQERGDLEAQHEQERLLQTYKAVSQRLAFKVAIGIGVFFSALGVRGLQAFVNRDEFGLLDVTQRTLFGLGDVLLTGLVLGGGSDGIHKLVSVITNFLDSVSIKAKEIGETTAATTATNKISGTPAKGPQVPVAPPSPPAPAAAAPPTNPTPRGPGQA